MTTQTLPMTQIAQFAETQLEIERRAAKKPSKTTLYNREKRLAARRLCEAYRLRQAPDSSSRGQAEITYKRIGARGTPSYKSGPA
jgi:hypothetical protein